MFGICEAQLGRIQFVSYCQLVITTNDSFYGVQLFRYYVSVSRRVLDCK